MNVYYKRSKAYLRSIEHSLQTGDNLDNFSIDCFNAVDLAIKFICYQELGSFPLVNSIRVTLKELRRNEVRIPAMSRLWDKAGLYTKWFDEHGTLSGIKKSDVVECVELTKLLHSYIEHKYLKGR